jgi:tetratricopeptide (TPR) repeat protein
MKQSYFKLLTLLLVLSLGLLSFHCASPEMTSARLYVQQQQWNEALAALEREIEVNPENAEAWYLKGRVLSEIGNPEEMLNAFDRSVELSNEYADEIREIRLNNWATYINAGIEEYNLGQEDPENYRYAIELFELAALMEPDSTIAYKNWGFAHLILGEMDEALIPFHEVLDREEDSEIAKYVGQIYFDQGYQKWSQYYGREDVDPVQKAEVEELMEQAITYLTRSMEANPEDGEVVATLSNAFIVLERTDEAKDIFRRGIETDPENRIYYYNLGVLILEEDKFEEAIGYFKQAIELDPDYYDAYYNLGVAYVNWGVELREEAVEARDDEDKRYLEKFQQALPNLLRTVDHRPNDAILWETLGRLYANLDRVQEAENAFERADQIRTADGE